MLASPKLPLDKTKVSLLFTTVMKSSTLMELFGRVISPQCGVGGHGCKLK